MSDLSLEITCREIPNSAAIETKIRQKVDKLTKRYHQIEFCKVVIELAQKHQHQGREFAALIELGVPGKRLVVNHKQDEDLYVVIRDAFAAMQKQIAHFAHRKRGAVKAHSEKASGKIVRLFTDYGFIEDITGREFYFNASNVTHQIFNELMVGDSVHFLEVGIGDSDSLQAGHVTLVKGLIH